MKTQEAIQKDRGNIKGFSITICFGNYSGFYLYTSTISTRVCFGWMAITIYWQHDLEAYIVHLKGKTIDDYFETI